MIGNYTDAAAIYELAHYRPYNWRQEASTQGFEWVGGGSFREVWRKGPVVYKVESLDIEEDDSDYPLSTYGNVAELRNAIALSNTPGIPEITGWEMEDQHTVNAMEYYPESVEREDKDARDIAKAIPLDDIKPMNMRRDALGQVWAVDLAAPALDYFESYFWDKDTV